MTSARTELCHSRWECPLPPQSWKAPESQAEPADQAAHTQRPLQELSADAQLRREGPSSKGVWAGAVSAPAPTASPGTWVPGAGLQHPLGVLTCPPLRGLLFSKTPDRE